MTDRTSTVLVSGATGSIGTRLIPVLTERGADVRVLVRHPDGRLPRLTKVSPVAADVGDPASLAAAMSGVDALFLACGNVPEQVAFECAAIDAAAAAGVGRVVKLSARGAAADSTVAYWRWHAEIEARLHDSGLAWALLRPSFSMANLFAAADHVRTAGMIAAPAGDARISMIDPSDVARVAAAALLEDGHAGRTYTLSGPVAIGYRQVAESLTQATGSSVRFFDVPPEAAIDAMVGAGLPPFVAEQLAAIFAALRAGAQEATTGDVLTVTGREPRSFAEFLDEVAGAFINPRAS